MVLAVIGNPGDHWPLDRGGAKCAENAAKRRAGREAAVGEQAMEAHGDPRAGQEIDHGQDREVAPAKGVRPGLPGGQAEEHEGRAGNEPGRDPIGRLVGDRLHSGGRRAGPRRRFWVHTHPVPISGALDGWQT